MAITSTNDMPRLDPIDAVEHTSSPAALTADPNSLLAIFDGIEASIAGERGSEEFKKLSRRAFFH